MTQPGAPVIRLAAGRLGLQLDDTGRRVVASLVRELRVELENPASAAADGSLGRLYPAAFPEDPDAEASYRDLVLPGLVGDRLARVAVVEATLTETEVDDSQASAWLAVLNDLRLAMAARLGIEDDADADRMPDEDDPDAFRRLVFAYLGYLVDSFVDVLAAALPESPDADR